MFKRKLAALDHPKPDTNVTDDTEFRSLIVWLEDQKIRHYKIEDRAGLRNLQGADWGKHFTKYLEDLNYSSLTQERSALVDWLLGYAVRLEYGDDVAKYKDVSAGQNGSGDIQSDNPLDSMSFDDPDFKAGIMSLATLLQIPPHEDNALVLKAICLLVKERLSVNALSASHQSTSIGEKIENVPLDKTTLGFTTGDHMTTEAAKILRLLHIQELRDLQTSINEAIVRVQAITANPKTDAKLGKVGIIGK